MIHKFHQWLNENSKIELNESVATAKKRFLDNGRVSDSEFEDAMSFDKSPTGKYVEKILDFYIKGDKRVEREMSKIGEVFIEFHDLLERNKIKKGDITSYKTIEELKSAVKEAQKDEIQKETEELTGGNFDIVVNNDDMLIVIPLDHEASMLWGGDTKWCTTSTNDHHWKSYIMDKDMCFYYIWIKNLDLIENLEEFENRDRDSSYLKEIESLSKMAVAIYPGSSHFECYDKNDNNISFDIVGMITGYDGYQFDWVEIEKPHWYYGLRELELNYSDVEENEDGTINYNGDVWIYYPEYQSIPFNEVTGDWMSQNEHNQDITSMRDCYLPNEIGYNFEFNNTNIEDLQGCPKRIGNNCNISDNPKLKSIEGAPEIVGGDFDYRGTELSLSKNSKIRMSADDIRKFIKVEGKIINDRGEWEEGESDEKAFWHPDQLELFNESKKIKKYRR
jgi:hypothetical protein